MYQKCKIFNRIVCFLDSAKSFLECNSFQINFNQVVHYIKYYIYNTLYEILVRWFLFYLNVWIIIIIFVKLTYQKYVYCVLKETEDVLSKPKRILTQYF